MGWSCDLLRPSQREFDFAARRLPGLLDVCVDDNDPPPDRRHVERASDPVAPVSRSSHSFPSMCFAAARSGSPIQLGRYARLAVGSAPAYPPEARRSLQRPFVQDFNSPAHSGLFLIFGINRRGPRLTASRRSFLARHSCRRHRFRAHSRSVGQVLTRCLEPTPEQTRFDVAAGPRVNHHRTTPLRVVRVLCGEN